MESCVSFDVQALKVAPIGPDHVYVCLNCGRRSCDPLGYHALTRGWGRSCSQAAVRLPSEALHVDDRGVVLSIRKDAITRLQASAALN